MQPIPRHVLQSSQQPRKGKDQQQSREGRASSESQRGRDVPSISIEEASIQIPSPHSTHARPPSSPFLGSASRSSHEVSETLLRRRQRKRQRQKDNVSQTAQSWESLQSRLRPGHRSGSSSSSSRARPSAKVSSQLLGRRAETNANLLISTSGILNTGSSPKSYNLACRVSTAEQLRALLPTLRSKQLVNPFSSSCPPVDNTYRTAYGQSPTLNLHVTGTDLSRGADPPVTYIPPSQAQESSGSSHTPGLRSRRADKRLLNARYMPPEHASSSRPIAAQPLIDLPTALGPAKIQASPVSEASSWLSQKKPLGSRSSSLNSARTRKQMSPPGSLGQKGQGSRSSDSHDRSGASSSARSQALPSYLSKTGHNDRLREPDPGLNMVQHSASNRRTSSSRNETDLIGYSQKQKWPRRKIKRPVERLQRRDGTMRSDPVNETLPSSSIVHELESYFQRPVIHGETNYLKEYSPPSTPNSPRNPVLVIQSAPLRTLSIAIPPIPPLSENKPGKDIYSGTPHQGKRNITYWSLQRQLLIPNQQLHETRSAEDNSISTLAVSMDTQTPPMMNRRKSVAFGELRAPSYFTRPRRAQQTSSTSTPSTAVSPLTSVRHPFESETPTLIDQALWVSTIAPPTAKSPRLGLRQNNALESISDHSLSSDKVPTLTQAHPSAILKRTLKSVSRKWPLQTSVSNKELHETAVTRHGNSDVGLSSLASASPSPHRGNVKKANGKGFRALCFHTRFTPKRRTKLNELEQLKRSEPPRPGYSIHAKSLDWLLQKHTGKRSPLSAEQLNPKPSQTSFATIQRPLRGPAKSMEEPRHDSVGVTSFEYMTSDLEVTDFHQTPFSTRYHDARRAEKLGQRALLEEALLNIQHRADDNEHTDFEYELDLPDHLPNSPLCPLSPKHRNGEAGICPMHGRRTAVIATRSYVRSGVSQAMPLFQSRPATSRAPRIVYEGREGDESASERKWEAYRQQSPREAGDLRR
nr:hypothetical protein CFP56_20866 [Quercus suber]